MERERDALRVILETPAVTENRRVLTLRACYPLPDFFSKMSELASALLLSRMLPGAGGGYRRRRSYSRRRPSFRKLRRYARSYRTVRAFRKFRKSYKRGFYWKKDQNGNWVKIPRRGYMIMPGFIAVRDTTRNRERAAEMAGADV